MDRSRRTFLATLAGLGAFAVTAHAKTPPLPARTFAVIGTLFTGLPEARPQKDQLIAVRDGRVEFITPVRTVTDRPLVDMTGKTILPGIINAHCHRVHAARDRRERWLEHGVTGIGDCASPLDRLPLLAEAPIGKTATASRCGPMLTPPSGYPLPVHSPDHALIVTSPQSGKEAVERLFDAGATQIKIAFEPGVMSPAWPCFDVHTAETICSRAHALGMLVRCHVEDLSGLKPALNAGVDTIEHVPHRWHKQGRITPVLTETGEVVPNYQRLLERIVAEGVILTPTLDVFTRTPWNGPALFEPVRLFHALGGTIAVGNDFPYRRTDAGMVLREMRLLTRAGLSNTAALRAATAHSAAACGMTNRGTLTPGAQADFLVVEGDPTIDLDTLKRPRHIVKDGVFIS